MNTDSKNNDKDRYPLTKSLTDDQFARLSVNQVLLLQIDWTCASSIKSPTGTKKAFQRNLLDPPPSYFAATDDIDANVKQIRKWWALESGTLQSADIEKYDSMGLNEKVIFQRNIISLLNNQQFLIQTVRGEPISVSFMEEDDRIGRERSVSDASLASNARARSRQRTTAGYNSTRTSTSTSTSASATASRTRSGSNGTRQDDSMEIDEESVEEDTVEESGHLSGFFSTAGVLVEEDVMPGGPKKATTTSHVGSKVALERGVLIAHRLASYVELTPTGNDMKRDCNDFFLVNFRNVKSTTVKGGDRNVHPLEDDKKIVTVFCRSQLHFLRMLNATVKATMVAEDPDTNAERFHLYEHEYVVGTEELSLKDALTQYKTRLLYESRGE